MPRIRLPLALSALILSGGLAAAGTTASASPSATAAKTLACKSGSSSTLKGGYYLGLKAAGTSCASARRVQTGYQNCRLTHGLAGRCTAKVVGYTCHERRQAIPTQVTGAVSCTNGQKRVSWTYQQNVV